MSKWEDKLLPCPFCGSSDLEIEESENADGQLCVRCGNNDCGCANAYVWYETCIESIQKEAREKMISIWNHRATQTNNKPTKGTQK